MYSLRREKQHISLKLEATQDIINEQLVQKILQADYKPEQTLKKYPNLIAVHHEEYDKNNENSKFKFGRLNIPELFSDFKFEHTWEEKRENAIQKSLKKQSLFSNLTLSALNATRNSIKKDVSKDKTTEERGDEEK